MKLVGFLQEGVPPLCIQPDIDFSGCTFLVCSLYLLLCCPTYSHDSELEFESKENAESGLSSANGHWVDCFLGLVRD